MQTVSIGLFCKGHLEHKWVGETTFVLPTIQAIRKLRRQMVRPGKIVTVTGEKSDEVLAAIIDHFADYGFRREICPLLERVLGVKIAIS